MNTLILFLIITTYWLGITAACKGSSDPDCLPQQVHIAFGEKSNDIVVVWSTLKDAESLVQYGQTKPSSTAQGASTLFTDGGRRRASQYIHRAVLPNLKFNTTYVYRAGSKGGWSGQFSFHTPPAGQHWAVRAAVYGDMGSTNAHALPIIRDDVMKSKYDLILHVGDFAYDMNTEDGRVGDTFMNEIQSIAASVPYMTCPGNHENAYNFSHYTNRFSMPGANGNLYYSFDLGPVHFISISSEVYYFTEYGAKLIVNQYEWLRQDLEEATKPKNRAKRPWIVLMGHRPMYCSNKDDADCSLEYTRIGILGMFGLEPFLNKYGVDLVVWAHEHSYERTFPLYNNRVYNGSYDQPYVNPGAPVHIITGSAGCKEDTDGFKPAPAAWSAFRSSDYGYTRLLAHNHTHLHLEQVSVHTKVKAPELSTARPNATIIDSFWLVKDRHEPYHLAPVHVITGSAGCKEGRDHFRHTPPKWSAFRSQDYGLTRLRANRTHIAMEQVSADLHGTVIDSFCLVKNTRLRFDEL